MCHARLPDWRRSWRVRRCFKGRVEGVDWRFDRLKPRAEDEVGTLHRTGAGLSKCHEALRMVLDVEQGRGRVLERA